jgi:hypothetical protein
MLNGLEKRHPSVTKTFAMRRLILFAALPLVLLNACTSQPDCTPTQGFEHGRIGQEPPPLCQERDYAEAWQLGQTLGELEAERDALLEREHELEPIERSRLRVLTRDIPELETLARIEGYLPAAEPDLDPAREQD